MTALFRAGSLRFGRLGLCQPAASASRPPRSSHARSHVAVPVSPSSWRQKIRVAVDAYFHAARLRSNHRNHLMHSWLLATHQRPRSLAAPRKAAEDTGFAGDEPIGTKAHRDLGADRRIELDDGAGHSLLQHLARQRRRLGRHCGRCGGEEKIPISCRSIRPSLLDVVPPSRR